MNEFDRRTRSIFEKIVNIINADKNKEKVDKGVITREIGY